MLYLYSNELSFEDRYPKSLKLSNGTKANLGNINRSNRWTDIYFKFSGSGYFKINLYRGYLKNRILNYELSNTQIVNVSLGNYEYKFQDFTALNTNYINYYIEIVALGTVEIQPLETGLYFDDILGVTGVEGIHTTTLTKDINSIPLINQQYDIYKNLSFVINAVDKSTILNVTDKPFYFVYNNGVFNYDSRRLSNISINLEYINNSKQYLNVTLSNNEEIKEIL